MPSIDDMTLEDIRVLLAPSIAGAAAFDGWSDVAVAAAARDAGISPEVARLAYPAGAMDMIAGWIEHVDGEMERAIPAASLQELSIRQRIRRLVRFRLDAVAGQEESLRRALAIMAMPQNLKRSVRLGWATADRMWRLAGDASTDIAHYTKRATLAGIYAATLSVFIDDHSDGKQETLAFLDRRIEGIIRFEKAKARMLPDENNSFSMARFLGRLRYPAR
jgi:ubiquinone biosynthesis protein COQ9